MSRGSARARRGLPAREFIGNNSAQSGKTVLGYCFARLGGAERPFSRVERGRGPEEDKEEEKAAQEQRQRENHDSGQAVVQELNSHVAQRKSARFS